MTRRKSGACSGQPVLSVLGATLCIIFFLAHMARSGTVNIRADENRLTHRPERTILPES